MSTRIAGTPMAAVVVLLCGIARGQVMPVPPDVLVGQGPAVIGLIAPRPRPTELDKAYYYSAIGQDLAYAKLRENATGKPDIAAPNPQPQIGRSLPSSLLPILSRVSPLSSVFCPAVSSLCPPSSRLAGRPEAPGCRR